MMKALTSFTVSLAHTVSVSQAAVLRGEVARVLMNEASKPKSNTYAVILLLPLEIQMRRISLNTWEMIVC